MGSKAEFVAKLLCQRSSNHSHGLTPETSKQYFICPEREGPHKFIQWRRRRA